VPQHHTAWVPRDHLGELVNAANRASNEALLLPTSRLYNYKYKGREEVYGKGAVQMVMSPAGSEPKMTLWRGQAAINSALPGAVSNTDYIVSRYSVFLTK
jgi:hypothetical protein